MSRPHPPQGSARPPVKLPAYGKQLLAARRSGTHPAVVVVVYGQDWSVPGVWARLAVKPKAALGLNWHCVAGVGVQVLDRSTAAEDDYDEQGNRELFFLLGEIARHAAGVQVRTPEPLFAHQSGGGEAHADVLAWCSRRWDAQARRMVWPAWWSQETDRIHIRNFELWLAETERYVSRIRAERVSA